MKHLLEANGEIAEMSNSWTTPHNYPLTSRTFSGRLSTEHFHTRYHSSPSSSISFPKYSYSPPEPNISSSPPPRPMPRRSSLPPSPIRPIQPILLSTIDPATDIITPWLLKPAVHQSTNDIDRIRRRRVGSSRSRGVDRDVDLVPSCAVAFQMCNVMGSL